MSRPVAVVTGAGRGIGRAIALTLARDGFDLALPLLSTGDEEALSVLAEVEALGGRGEAMPFDLGEAEAHAHTARLVVESFGRLDVLVNNAGIGQPVRDDPLELSPAHFDAVMDVNLRGTLFFSLACAREMVAGGETGHPRAIVTITSVSAEMVSPERLGYCISKAGLSMAVKGLAARLAEEGIAVFEVRPGIIRTPMTSAVAPVYDRRIADGLVPARRWGEPDDVAAMVAALASGRLGFATGSVIHVDGGLAVPRL
jgi:NAD(P)-dependent dehydrogenase (short-subunit alcohol dehydrogenase family)